jgi:hypothetical protein
MRRQAVAALLCALAPIAARALDLVESGVSASPSPVGSALQLSVTDTVTSVGEGSTGFFVYFYLSTDATIGADDLFIGGRWVDGLLADVPSTETTVVSLPLNVWGTYYVGAIADAPGWYTDAVPTNNTAAWVGETGPAQLTVLQPNLRAVAVGTTLLPSESGVRQVPSGGVLTVQSVMAVADGIPDYAIVDYYLVPPAGDLLTQGILIAERVIWNADGWQWYPKPGPLWFRPGAPEEAEFTVQLPLNVWGNFQVAALIRTDDGAPDAYSFDNTVFSPYVVTVGQPDLIATSVSATGPTSLQVGETLTIRSLMAVADGIPDYAVVDYYLVPPGGDPVTQGTFVAERVIWNADGWQWYPKAGPLWFRPGEPETEELAVAIPAGLLGQYRLAAFIHTDEPGADPDTSNNTVFSAQVLQIGCGAAPQLVVFEPPGGFETSSSTMTVRGWVAPASSSTSVLVSSASSATVTPASDGTFSANVTVQQGAASIAVTATDACQHAVATTIAGRSPVPSEVPDANGCVVRQGTSVFALSSTRYCYDGAGNMTARLVAVAGQACGGLVCP